MAYPIGVKLDGFKAGEIPVVRATYQCDDVDDAMAEVRKAVAVHGNVNAHYDRETRVLTLELS